MINTNPLSGIPPGSHADGWALIRSTKAKTSKNNNSYLVWEGFDINKMVVAGTMFGEGQLPPKRFPDNTVVAVTGSIGEGLQGNSVWAKSMVEVTDKNDVETFKNLCLPSVPKEELDKYMTDIATYLGFIQDKGLKELADALFDYFKDYLPIKPAGKKNHEPYRGGLAKHTWEVVTLVHNNLFYNKGLNKDVLLFSAVFHDIGKSIEYDDNMGITIDGRLSRHPVIAMEFITDVIARRGIDVDKNLLRQVKHCILTHHGPEVSDVKPATREALVIHHADHVMSVLGHVDEAIRIGEIGTDGFGTYSSWLNAMPYVPELDDGNKGTV